MGDTILGRQTVDCQQRGSVDLAKIVNNSVAALLAVLVLLFGSSLVHCQVTGATLSGTITDASGGVIPGAHISITNTATGINQEFQADSAGYYTAPNLAPGTYEVKVTAQGFSRTISTMTLAVGAQQQLNIS